MGAAAIEQPRRGDYASVARFAGCAGAIEQPRRGGYTGVARLASGRRGRGVHASGEEGGSRLASGMTYMSFYVVYFSTKSNASAPPPPRLARSR